MQVIDEISSRVFTQGESARQNSRPFCCYLSSRLLLGFRHKGCRDSRRRKACIFQAWRISLSSHGFHDFSKPITSHGHLGRVA